MFSNKAVTITDSINLSVLFKDKYKDSESRFKQENELKKKDPKKMTIEELDEYLDNTVSNIKIHDRLNSSLISTKFINLNFQDPLKSKIEKQISKDSEKTEKMIKEFGNDLKIDDKKLVFESSDKYFQKSKTSSSNNLFKSHNNPSLSSLLFNNSHFQKINDKTDNFSRKCNEDKMVKLNEFLDERLKDQKKITGESNKNEEECELQKENKELIRENSQLKELVQRKDEDLRNYKELLSNNEKLFQEIERKLKNEVNGLIKENSMLKSSIDHEGESSEKRQQFLSNVLSENKTLKDDLDKVIQKMRDCNECLNKKQEEVEELKKEIETKLNPQIIELRQSIEKHVADKNMLLKEIEKLVELNKKIKNKGIKQIKSERNNKEIPNYMKNTKSRQNMIASSSPERKVIGHLDNKQNEEIRRKLYKSKSTFCILRETEITKRIKQLEDNVKELEKNSSFVDYLIQKCTNKGEMLQLNRNLSLILSNLDKEKKELNDLLLEKKNLI